MTIAKTKAALDEAKAHYLSIANTAPAEEQRAASEKIKAFQSELSALITEGAKPCPSCGGAPVGIEQPGPTFEVGCSSCGWFRHTDGTVRDHSARGGIMPRHTVEAWNEGPDWWRQATVGDGQKVKFTTAEAAKLPTREEIAAKAKMRAEAIKAKAPVRT